MTNYDVVITDDTGKVLYAMRQLRGKVLRQAARAIADDAHGAMKDASRPGIVLRRTQKRRRDILSNISVEYEVNDEEGTAVIGAKENGPLVYAGKFGFRKPGQKHPARIYMRRALSTSLLLFGGGWEGTLSS